LTFDLGCLLLVVKILAGEEMEETVIMAIV
jgi:hypothetical protein